MTAPAKLAAIVDWEMGTIGDPRLDLAGLLGSRQETPRCQSRGRPRAEELRDHGRPGHERRSDDLLRGHGGTVVMVMPPRAELALRGLRGRDSRLHSSSARGGVDELVGHPGAVR